MLIRRSLLLLIALVACQTPVPYVAPIVVPGAPQAGAAEGTIDLPIGVPMAGYSGRSHLLGGESKPDNRASAYTVGFVESAGIQTRPTVKTVWLHNGDDHLVIIKVDLIYSNDMLVEDVTAELEARTGQDLEGRVIISASHSHQSWGPFSDQFHFYLGGDKFNPEIYARLVLQLVQTSETAWDDRQDVSIGTAWARDWDPDDRIYRDRREQNDALQVWDDLPAGYGKDPHLNMIRVDALDGSPVAMMFTFGMHGTAVGGSSAMVSSDAPGGVEMALREQFDHEVVVMHLQGSGGDASPGGSGERFERLENVGQRAVAPIMDLWERTPTSDAPIALESASRHIPEFRDQIRVTRDGEVDWFYSPMGTVPDGEIYDADGDIIGPIDEFNAPYGAAFCGSEEPLIPAGGIGAQVFPYDSCVDAGLVSRILYALFDIEEGEISLPMPSSLKAGTTASLVGPLVTLTPDGEQVERPLFVSFFPGEPTAMFGEQFRRRAEAELGHPMALMVGYAQDHEGYLMIPEDWLMGGYEPNIALWGPLQGEHIMEGVLDYSSAFLGNEVHDDTAAGQVFAPTQYKDKPLPEITPDLTPDAGTQVSSIPMERFYMPNDMRLDLSHREQVPRVQGIVQLAWFGGDTMVDLPVVTL
ncbi:MAG: neutral ceramidase, partial [Kiritimatiellia bacterium]